jgi:hypothetical protein
MRRFEMNEDLKRLIEVLNKGGNEVVAFEDRDGVTTDAYDYSGIFSLTVFDRSKYPSKS